MPPYSDDLRVRGVYGQAVPGPVLRAAAADLPPPGQRRGRPRRHLRGHLGRRLQHLQERELLQRHVATEVNDQHSSGVSTAGIDVLSCGLKVHDPMYHLLLYTYWHMFLSNE